MLGFVFYVIYSLQNNNTCHDFDICGLYDMIYKGDLLALIKEKMGEGWERWQCLQCGKT